MGQYPLVLRIKAETEEQAVRLAVEWGEERGCESCFDYSSSEGEVIREDPRAFLRAEELRRHALLLAEATEGEMTPQKGYKLILAGEAFDQDNVQSPERLYFDAAKEYKFLNEGPNEYFIRIYRHI